MAQDPQLFLNQLMMTNPQVQQAIDYIKLNGGNGQAAFYNLAKQFGIDPQAFLNSINSK